MSTAETLIATGIGATAALAGSLIVNRRELTRRQRIALYDELLPAFRAAIATAGVYELPDVDDLYQRIFRAATIAGERTRWMLVRMKLPETFTQWKSTLGDKAASDEDRRGALLWLVNSCERVNFRLERWIR